MRKRFAGLAAAVSTPTVSRGPQHLARFEDRPCASDTLAIRRQLFLKMLAEMKRRTMVPPWLLLPGSKGAGRWDGVTFVALVFMIKCLGTFQNVLGRT